MIEPSIITNKIMEAAGKVPFASMLKSKPFEGTQVVMDIFGKLGRDLGYRVSCHQSNYPTADDGEWMYDMTWWQPGKNNHLVSMPMVLETELNRTSKQHDNLDDDFQKLIQARADIRVWISTSPDNPRKHIDNCKEQIQSFSGTMSGDQYIFAVYNFKTGTPLIEKFAAL